MVVIKHGCVISDGGDPDFHAPKGFTNIESWNIKEYHFRQLNILSTTVRDHMLDCNHVVAWDDFKVLGKESNHWLLEIKESLDLRLIRIFTPGIVSILVLRFQ